MLDYNRLLIILLLPVFSLAANYHVRFISSDSGPIWSHQEISNLNPWLGNTKYYWAVGICGGNYKNCGSDGYPKFPKHKTNPISNIAYSNAQFVACPIGSNPVALQLVDGPYFLLSDVGYNNPQVVRYSGIANSENPSSGFWFTHNWHSYRVTKIPPNSVPSFSPGCMGMTTDITHSKYICAVAICQFDSNYPDFELALPRTYRDFKKSNIKNSNFYVGPIPCPSNFYCENRGLDFCPDSFLCEDGRTKSCPDSKYCYHGMELDCPEGKICSDGRIHDCPPNMLCHDSSTFICPDNFHCEDGLKVECPYGKKCVDGKVLDCPPNKECFSGTVHNCSALHYCENGIDFPCPAGSVCINGTKTSCPKNSICLDGKAQKCPDFKLCPNGIATPCPEGFICQNGIMDKCPVGCYCTNGHFSLCDTGYICKDGFKSLCPPGFYCYNRRVFAAQVCPIGFYCPAGSSKPIPCLNGYVCPRSGMADPEYCEGDMFTPNYVVTNPSDSNYYPPLVLDRNIADNAARAPLLIYPGYRECLSPTPGYISGTFLLNNTFIQNDTYINNGQLGCPANTYADSSLNKCVDCEPNSYSPPVSVECFSCESIKKSISEDTSCQEKCEIGHFCSNSICKQVEPGYFYPPSVCAISQNSQLPCPIGYYSDVYGALMCKPCAPGACLSTGSTGYYQDLESQLADYFAYHNISMSEPLKMTGIHKHNFTEMKHSHTVHAYSETNYGLSRRTFNLTTEHFRDLNESLLLHDQHRENDLVLINGIPRVLVKQLYHSPENSAKLFHHRGIEHMDDAYTYLESDVFTSLHNPKSDYLDAGNANEMYDLGSDGKWLCVEDYLTNNPILEAVKQSANTINKLYGYQQNLVNQTTKPKGATSKLGNTVPGGKCVQLLNEFSFRTKLHFSYQLKQFSSFMLTNNGGKKFKIRIPGHCSIDSNEVIPLASMAMKLYSDPLKIISIDLTPAVNLKKFLIKTTGGAKDQYSLMFGANTLDEKKLNTFVPAEAQFVQYHPQFDTSNTGHIPVKYYEANVSIENSFAFTFTVLEGLLHKTELSLKDESNSEAHFDITHHILCPYSSSLYGYFSYRYNVSLGVEGKAFLGVQIPNRLNLIKKSFKSKSDYTCLGNPVLVFHNATNYPKQDMYDVAYLYKLNNISIYIPSIDGNKAPYDADYIVNDELRVPLTPGVPIDSIIKLPGTEENIAPSFYGYLVKNDEVLKSSLTAELSFNHYAKPPKQPHFHEREYRFINDAYDCQVTNQDELACSYSPRGSLGLVNVSSVMRGSIYLSVYESLSLNTAYICAEDKKCYVLCGSEQLGPVVPLIIDKSNTPVYDLNKFSLENTFRARITRNGVLNHGYCSVLSSPSSLSYDNYRAIAVPHLNLKDFDSVTIDLNRFTDIPVDHPFYNVEIDKSSNENSIHVFEILANFRSGDTQLSTVVPFNLTNIANVEPAIDNNNNRYIIAAKILNPDLPLIISLDQNIAKSITIKHSIHYYIENIPFNSILKVNQTISNVRSLFTMLPDTRQFNSYSSDSPYLFYSTKLSTPLDSSDICSSVMIGNMSYFACIAELSSFDSILTTPVTTIYPDPFTSITVPVGADLLVPNIYVPSNYSLVGVDNARLQICTYSSGCILKYMPRLYQSNAFSWPMTPIIPNHNTTYSVTLPLTEELRLIDSSGHTSLIKLDRTHVLYKISPPADGYIFSTSAPLFVYDPSSPLLGNYIASFTLPVKSKVDYEVFVKNTTLVRFIEEPLDKNIVLAVIKYGNGTVIVANEPLQNSNLNNIVSALTGNYGTDQSNVTATLIDSYSFSVNVIAENINWKFLVARGLGFDITESYHGLFKIVSTYQDALEERKHFPHYGDPDTQVICPEGYMNFDVIGTNECVLCPIDHYCINGIAHPCPEGYYSNKEGASSCKPIL